jgi:acyl carrier protein
MNVYNNITEYIMSDIARGKVTDSIEPTYNLIDSGVIDSVGIMKLIIYLEGTYSIHVSDDDLTPENFSTIMSIQSLVEGKVNSNGQIV